MKTILRSLGLVVLTLSLSGAWADPQQPEPASEKPAAAAPAPASADTMEKRDTTTKTYSGEAQKLRTDMIGLFKASEKVNAPAEKNQARGLIESSVDWDRISKTCLGNAAKKQSASNQAEFSKLLKQVILKTAFSRMDTFWDGTTFKFEKIDVKGKDAQVKAKFKVKDESISLEYYMDKKGDKWMLYDITVDDLRYSEVVSEKVATFLRDGKFPGLLESLRKRLDELDKDKESNKKS